MLKIPDSIVSVDWLFQNLNQPNLVILDAKMKKIIWEKNEFENSNNKIKNARFIDISTRFSDTSAPFPNTMLSAEDFQEQSQKLGINKESAIVVYDTIGMYTSPRVWWMFKSMGHKNIAVLNGGFPEWILQGFPIENNTDIKYDIGNFKAVYNPNFFSNSSDVLKAIDDFSVIVVDARSEDRFHAIKPEPREGVRSGHIPTSFNLPYQDLLIDGKLKDNEHLQRKFQKMITQEKHIIFSCGSGITACILALGAEVSGYKNISIYDGSWTEWGSNKKLPINK